MAPSFQRISVPIDSAQWRLIRRYLLKTDDEEEDEQNTTKDESSQWEDVDSDSDGTEEETDGNVQPASRINAKETPWLQTIHVATIPTFELLVFANGTRVVALESNGNGQWKILFQKDVNEEVSAVTCLPVAPTRMSDPRPYEWTAVLIGTEDGRLFALNERGDEILNHRFHVKPVIELRLQADQLFVAYPDYLTAVSGLTLLAVVKSNRQRLFRQRRGLDHQQGDAFPLPDSQLVHEFWKLENVTQPISVAATGPLRTSIWEKMMTASVKGGFNASISGRQPSYETYCATNTRNFISFNWWTDETPPNLLAGVASKIKTSLTVPLFSSSWWSPSKVSSNKGDGSSAAPVAPITSRNVPQRSNLPDTGRMGERLVLAPGDRLAAICDDLGRVSMLDVHRRLLLRMWKGYRDAQCAWIELPYSGQEKKDGEKNRCNVLCLVIYAPRRGILEVWSTQNGRRAAAFNVDRQGMLVYCPATTLTKSSSIDFSQALRFLDSSGQFFHIDISASVVIEPHETSTYWTAPAKEDFRKYWIGKLVEESQLAHLLDILGRLVWTKDIEYLVDHVVAASKIDYKLFVRFVEAAIARVTKDQEQHPDVRALYAHCLAYRQITHFAAMILKYHDPKFQESDSEGDDIEGDVHQFLALQSSEELDGLLRDLDGNLKIRFESTKVDSKPLDPSHILQEFLSSIDYRSLSHVSFTPTPTFNEQMLRLRFRKDVDDATVLAELGDFVFKPFLDGSCSMDEFRRNAQPLLGLVDRDWIRLFCSYWLHKTRSYSVHPVRLYNLFCVLSARDDCKRELGSDFLQEVRRLIIDCSRIAEALSLSMVVRAMARNTTLKEGDSDWLKIDKDVEDWDILQTTLHSVLLLDTCCRHVTSENNTEMEPISLHQLLQTGAGYLSEYVAKSFVSADRSVDGNQFNDLSSEAASESWAMALERAREMLPLSLETERLVLGILWEYVRVWHKTPTRVDCLKSATGLLGDVQDERLRQGFASLAWRTFFRQHYEKLCNAMMASNGKDCSDAFERESGVPATSLLEFTRFVYTLFNVMKESVERYQEGAAKRYETEDFLNNFFLAFRHDVSDERSGNRESLWDLLSRQPANSKSQIHRHWQLTASVLVAVTTNFETRLTPLNLFSWDQRSDLFKSISVGSRGDDDCRLSDEDTEQQQLDNRRLLFLLSYVTVAIKRSLPSISNAEETSEKNLLPDLSLAVKLARAWGLNFDSVRRQEIVQLYLAGYPDLASKLLPLVEERKQLASTLLDIAGCALSDRWTSSPIVVKPKMSSGLWEWLIARKSTTIAKGPELSLDVCSSMLAFVSSSLSQGSAEYKVSDELKVMIDKLKS